MPTFMMLTKLTEKGIAARKDWPKRLEELRKIHKEAGVQHKEAFHTFGPYDGIHILEAPNGSAIGKLALLLESHGYVNVETRRVLTSEEYSKLVESLP